MDHAEDVEDTMPPRAGSAVSFSRSEADAASDAAGRVEAGAGAAAGSAVVAIVIAVVALCALFAGPVAIIPAIAGMIVSLRARKLLQGSPYRGYGISLVAFLLSLVVFALTVVPVVMPLVSVMLFSLR